MVDIHCSYNNTFIIKPSDIFDVINYFIKRNKLISYDNREQIISELKLCVANGQDENIRKRHVQNIEDMLYGVEHKTTKSK